MTFIFTAPLEKYDFSYFQVIVIININPHCFNMNLVRKNTLQAKILESPCISLKKNQHKIKYFFIFLK